MLKRLTATAGHHPAFIRFVDLLEKVDPQQPDLLRVLTYHRVDEPEARPHLYPGMAVRPDAFEQQMRYLQAHYVPVSVQQVLEAIENGVHLPKQAVLISFDDAYRDFGETAWPILKGFGIPVVLFVPTAFPGCQEYGYWWDQMYAAFLLTKYRGEITTPWGEFSLADSNQRSTAFKHLQEQMTSLPHPEVLTWVEKLQSELEVISESEVLNWEELRRLAGEGVALGAHTQSHPLLTQITVEQVRSEIFGSINDLEREMETTLPIFAYPGGYLTDEATQILEAAGVRLAFTTRRGINDMRRDDPLRLRRINVGSRSTTAVLRAQLLARTKIFFR